MKNDIFSNKLQLIFDGPCLPVFADKVSLYFRTENNFAPCGTKKQQQNIRESEGKNTSRYRNLLKQLCRPKCCSEFLKTQLFRVILTLQADSALTFQQFQLFRVILELQADSALTFQQFLCKTKEAGGGIKQELTQGMENKLTSSQPKSRRGRGSSGSPGFAQGLCPWGHPGEAPLRKGVLAGRLWSKISGLRTSPKVTFFFFGVLEL